jgi:hypothetical protein
VSVIGGLRTWEKCVSPSDESAEQTGYRGLHLAGVAELLGEGKRRGGRIKQGIQDLPVADRGTRRLQYLEQSGILYLANREVDRRGRACGRCAEAM